eukprot:gene9301-1389_t
MKRLTEGTIASIQSTYALLDICQVIEELTLNSIDAKSKNIKISFNLNEFDIIISDDGEGISKNNMNLIGNRFSTSKISTLSHFESGIETFGYRGEAIASISELSKIKIISRSGDSYETFSKIIEFGKASKVELEKPRNRGTTIIIENLFQNQPLRKNFNSKSSEIKKILNSFQRISIPFYNEINFILEDSNHQILFQTKNNRIEEFLGVQQNQIINLNSKLITGVFSKIEEKNTLQLSKQNQFIFLKKKFIINDTLQDAFNSIFFKFFFSFHEKENEKIYQKIDYFPVFIVNLNIEPDKYDLTMDLYKKEILIDETILKRITDDLTNIFESQYKNKLSILSKINKPNQVECKIDEEEKFEIKKSIINPERKLYLKSKDNLSLYQNYENSQMTYGNLIQKNERILKKEIQKEVSISKEMLKKMIVIDQIDKKFIIVMHNDFLFIIDQHAAHERIRYEIFQKDYLDFKNFKAGEKTKEVKLQTPLKIMLSNHEFHLLMKFELKLRQWSWNFNYENNTYQDMIERPMKSTVIIHLISSPKIEGILLTDKEFKSCLYEMEERGIQIIPNCIDEILKSKACRGAIMFGDILSKFECQQIISELSFCNFPFECAHGRPSILPLMEINK